MPTAETHKSERYTTVKEDFFSKPLDPPHKVTLMGARCLNCGEVFFGKVIACQNCQGENLDYIPLSKRGTLYTYTVIRNEPPGDYKVPKPFQPFAMGLVELPEGIRILAPLSCVNPDDVKIDTALELSIDELYKDEAGRMVLAYSFRPQESRRQYK
ncbi:Zn-ribbon domain-containing OB-fold protein [Chloroflexota bacterium]